MSKSVKGGIILIVAGIVLLLSQLGVIPGQIFLFMLALGFIATYVLLGGRKEYGNVGFLIPGTVLLAVGIFASLTVAPADGVVSAAYFFLLLGLSFFAVLLVHTMWFKELDHGGRFWPLYPAIGLFLFAGFIGFAESGRWVDYLSYLNYLWIVGLIVVGIWMIAKSTKSKKES
ncbi:MAG: hypothetical protein SCJ97_03650 [Bacillota bacterium]|nr:hypothetical protein [Bacillota bacterium]